MFPAIPTITPFATGCSNGSPIATSQVNCELGECRKFAALELHVAHAREHVPQPVGRTRGSCPLRPRCWSGSAPPGDQYTPRPGRDSVSYWRLIGASVRRDDRIPARLGAEGAADPEDPHCRRRELAGVRDGGGGSELEGE